MANDCGCRSGRAQERKSGIIHPAIKNPRPFGSSVASRQPCVVRSPAFTLPPSHHGGEITFQIFLPFLPHKITHPLTSANQEDQALAAQRGFRSTPHFRSPSNTCRPDKLLHPGRRFALCYWQGPTPSGDFLVRFGSFQNELAEGRVERQYWRRFKKVMEE